VSHRAKDAVHVNLCVGSQQRSCHFDNGAQNCIDNTATSERSGSEHSGPRSAAQRLRAAGRLSGGRGRRSFHRSCIV